MSSSSSVNSLLEKMASPDKDFRYMATNDLINGMKKGDFKIDPSTEKKMVSAVLKLLEDVNGEVQNLVVKCLPLMVDAISESQLEEVINKLSSNLSTGNEELRDISSTGLKSVIVELPTGSSVGGNLCKRLSPKLLESIQSANASYEVKMDSLDLLAELLSRFGTLMTSYHDGIVSALLKSLEHQRPAVRKRSAVALGFLVKNLGDKPFASLLSQLISKVSGSSDVSRSSMAAIALISRNSSKRLAKNLKELQPLLFNSLKKEDNELRESTLNVLENLIYQCPSESASLMEPSLDVCLDLIKYDPEFVDEGDEDEEMDDDLDDEFGAEDDDDFANHDDTSWKVRRASSKCLGAIFSSSLDLKGLVNQATPVLISRFKEREENVRIENFLTIIVLLRRCAVAIKQQRSVDSMDASDSLSSLIKEMVPKICKVAPKSLNDKSPKTKELAFSLLRELITVLRGGMEGNTFFSTFIAQTLTSKHPSSSLKIEAILLSATFFKFHDASAIVPLLPTLVDPLLQASSDKFYKIASESIGSLNELVQSLRPLSPLSSLPSEAAPHIQKIFSSIMKILTVHDLDQEIKEKAITCLGLLLAHNGDTLSSEVPQALSALNDKISNEITRVVAVKSLTTISNSPLKVDLSSILPQVETLSTFLRKKNRSLKLASLACLVSLVSTRGSSISSSNMESVINEVKGLINDSDLQILAFSLELLTGIIKVNPKSVSVLKSSDCLAYIFDLIRSPLLQGSSLMNLKKLLGEIVIADESLFAHITQSLMDPIVGNMKLTLSSSKQPFFSIAQCLGAVCEKAKSKAGETTKKINSLLLKGDDSTKYFCLLSFGEIGRLNVLGDMDVYETIISYFSDPSEEVKSAAAYALGNISVGNLQKYVPMILNEIKQQPKKQYLLLHALKEIIAQESGKEGAKDLSPFSDEIWSILFTNCESEEEGTRNAVAECIGKLAMLNPEKYIPSLQENLRSSSGFTRATVVVAIKFAFANPTQKYNHLLKPLIDHFLPLTQDSNLIVRRVALQALNSAAHNKATMVREQLSHILPPLYLSTVVQKDLIRIVTMGPFKYEVDDGEEPRKAAFECLLSILQSSHDILGAFDFLERIISGLSDRFDIKILAHITLIQLCSYFPSAVLQKIEEIVPPLESTINTKPKENAVKQEIEKNEEMIRSSLKAVVALMKVPEIDSNPKFSSFIKALQSSDQKGKLELLTREASERLESMDLS